MEGKKHRTREEAIRSTLFNTNRIHGAHCGEFGKIFYRQRQLPDYSGMLDTLEDLKGRIEQETDLCHGLSRQGNSDSSEDELLKALFKFQLLLVKRIDGLYLLVSNLLQKKEDRTFKYSFIAYRKDMKELHKMELESAALGKILGRYTEPYMSMPASKDEERESLENSQ